MDETRILAGMVVLRLISSLAELTGALLMWRSGTVKGAIQVNATLGLVGPIVLLLVSSLGIAGLAGQVSPWKLALVIAGVMLIFTGVG